jgi:hypothetical protein
LTQALRTFREKKIYLNRGSAEEEIFMPKYIAAVEGWGDLTNYADYLQNKSFEFNPIEIIADIKRTVWVNSVQDMVDKVLIAAGSSKIRWLVILGHGFSGWQSIGCGQGLDPTDTKHLSIESTTGKLAGNAEAELKRLKPILSPSSVVSLAGCETGSGTSGELLLKTISTILGGVAVEAGLNVQGIMPGYEGPVRRCTGNSCIIQSPSVFQ